MECPKCEREIKEEEKECPYCHYDLINKPKIEREKGLYRNWWFWVIIVIVVLAIIKNISDNYNININTSDNINNTTNTANYLQNLKKDYEDNIKLKTNPYEITDNYNGIYKFSLSSNNYTSTGVISFNNGECKIKYEYSANGGKGSIMEHQGFCGLNKEDDSIFYFSLNDNENYTVKTYKGIQDETGLLCGLQSEYDLCGNKNKELKLEKIENATDINTILTQILQEIEQRKELEEKAKKEQEEKTFKENCQTYTFEQIARNPENFKGTNVKLTGEVIQVMTDSYSTNLRVNITKNGNYSTYYTDTVYVVYQPQNGEDKILEKDIITIYGTSQGDCSYKTVLGSNVTLPNIQAKYITIQR